MSKYDPTAIRRMAALLNSAAAIIVGASVLLGFVTGLMVGSFVGVFLEIWLLGLIVGVVYLAIIGGIGYLISLVFRVIAQLMLALVQIEFNTSAALSEDQDDKVERKLVDTEVDETRDKSVVDSLTEQIRDTSAAISAAGAEANAAEVFELGRLWAMLFDETGEQKYRAKALRAMQRAYEIDPEQAQVDFMGDNTFGSLMSDPEFSTFTR